MDIATNIKKRISAAFLEVYGHNVDIKDIMLEHPKNSDFGDYASNIAIKSAKFVKQSPIDIAKNICYELNKIDHIFVYEGSTYNIFEKIDYVSPGFINIKLSEEWLCFILEDIISSDSNYGITLSEGKKTIALEHSNVNPNKAAHVGHLRNACIGQFLEKVYEFIGNDVKVQYYANDLGVQVTTSLMGMDLVKNVHAKDYDKYDHYAWDVYSEMETMISKNPELAVKRQNIMSKLEDATSDESRKQVTLSNKILIEQLKTFSELDFDYDVVVRERDIVTLNLWEEAFSKLKQNKNVYKATEGPSIGCWLIKLSDKNSSNTHGIEEDKIIVRSNGIPTYTGKDIAYHMWKFGLLEKDFYYDEFRTGTQTKPLYITASNKSSSSANMTFSNSDYILNVIDGKQSYALEAVRQALKFLGYEKEAHNMKHINYGFVYLSPNSANKLGIDTSDGKKRYDMSGRKGWGVKIDDFIKMVDNKLVESFGEFETLVDVRNGAIKFEMLKYNTFQDLVFDLDSALDINGYSGPYIQYAHARATSVLEKGAFVKDTNSSLFNMPNLHDKEINLLRHLYIFPEIVKRSAYEYAPNLMCTYLFDLAQKFNSFYNDVPILNADTPEEKEFRLKLTFGAKQIMKNGLYLLGIKAPNRM